MKKIISILFATVINLSALAGPHFNLSYINHTQNINGSSPTGVIFLYITANVGDSLTLSANEYDNGCNGNCMNGWLLNGTMIDSTNSYQLTIIMPQIGVFPYHTSSSWFGYNFHITVVSPTGINSFEGGQQPILKSNFVTSAIDLQLKLNQLTNIETSIVSVNGKVLSNTIYKNVVGEFIKNENIEQLAAGIYFLRVKINALVLNEKFIKVK